MRFDVESLQVFVKVAELSSFTAAAHQLQMPKARASAHVQKLEAALGTQLLHRSTRVVRTTPEGQQLLLRAHTFLADAEEIDALFQTGPALRGRVRIDMPVMVARDIVIPRLPELLARHTQLQLEVCASDRITPAMREGFDIVLRIGPVNEPGLVGRPLGVATMMNCVSPSYVRHHGIPHTLDDLRHHVVVHYAADAVPSFEYFDGTRYRDLPMRSVLTVDNFDAYQAAGVAGLGLVQIPRPALDRHGDALVEVLPQLSARPVPITLLHTHARSVPRRVRAVLSWLTEVLAPMVRDHLHPGLPTLPDAGEVKYRTAGK